MPIRRRSFKLIWLPLSLATLGLLFLVTGIIFQSVRLAVRRAGTANRLQQIEMALKCYHKANGCYPPQYLEDRHGKPAHSWRVLLLPYLNQEALFQRYRFDEPWDGPHNRLLAAEMPEVYRSPFLDSKSTIAQYVGIAGKNTLWRGATPLRDADMQCGASDFLIWFVEASNSDIIWTEPRDIPLEEVLAGIDVSGGGGVQSNYSDGLPAQKIPYGCEWVSPDKLRAMLTIGGALVQEPLTTNVTEQQAPRNGGRNGHD